MNTTLKSFIFQQNKKFVEAMNPDLDSVITPSVNFFLPVSTYPNYNQYNASGYSPYIGVNSHTSRIVSSGFYNDLNKDKAVQKTFTKYYYYKLMDKWIYKELMPLLAFIDISKDKPQLIKSMGDYDVKKLLSNTSEQIEKKIDYMEKVLITKDMVRHVLKKICIENNINWYDLDKHENTIKKIFYDYLLDKLKHSVGKYKNEE